MSEHSMFKAVLGEAKSVLVLVEDNLGRVWKDWSPFCVHLDGSRVFCTHEENTDHE